MELNVECCGKGDGRCGSFYNPLSLNGGWISKHDVVAHNRLPDGVLPAWNLINRQVSPCPHVPITYKLFMAFSISAKRLFLTYSQCELTIDDLLSHLVSLVPIVRLIIAQEKHQDGGNHFHVVFEAEKKLRIRRQDYFDYNGFHPSIESVKSWPKAVNYCKKDGDYQLYPDDAAFAESCPTEDLDASAFSDESEWLLFCIKRGIGYGFAARLWSIAHRDEGSTIFDARYEPTDSRLAFNPLRGWSSVLIGASGIGKTVWATQHIPRPALFVSHMDELRKFDAGLHKGIIFDDMTFLHLPVQSQIHLVDYEMPRQIHCRYNTVTIPAYTPKIFTCNEAIFAEHPAIARRIEFIL